MLNKTLEKDTEEVLKFVWVRCWKPWLHYWQYSKTTGKQQKRFSLRIFWLLYMPACLSVCLCMFALVWKVLLPFWNFQFLNIVKYKHALLMNW